MRYFWSTLGVLGLFLLVIQTFPNLKDHLGLPEESIGRYMLVSATYGSVGKSLTSDTLDGSVSSYLLKMDTTTGETWKYDQKTKAWLPLIPGM